MKDFISEITKKVLIYDGSKGYMLQRLGLKGGECPELWNDTHAKEVRSVYAAYKEAGSDVIQTNTFQGNRLVLKEYGLGERTYELNFKGVKMAREVMGEDGYVAASVGPLGKLFDPSGDLTFELAYDVFKEQVKALADGGADIINFETFTDLAEMRAALLAAKENTSLPVICSLAFEESGRTLMGTDPFTAAVVLRSLGADMIGTNCSFGPEHQLEIIKKMQPSGALLSAKPNAGLPEVAHGNVTYKETPEGFTRFTGVFVRNGVRLVGGCCGTTPEFISALRTSLNNLTAETEQPGISDISKSLIASNTKVLDIRDIKPEEIGRLDAAKDEELCQALRNGNLELVTDRSLDMAAEGYRAIYINVDSAGTGESLLANAVNAAQGYIREPFLLESRSASMLEAALRIYKGRAGVIINTEDSEEERTLAAVVSRYGSLAAEKLQAENLF